MVSRPHFNKAVAELRALAENNWSDYNLLHTIKTELGFRSTRKAAELKNSVEQRLAGLRRDSSNSKGGASQQKVEELQAFVVELERKLKAAQINAENAKRRVEEANTMSERLLQMQQQLSCAEASVRTAESRARKAETELARLQNSTDSYAAVGLIPNCPDFVFDTVRRAFLKKHHPDSLGQATETARSKAAEQFKRLHSLFERLAGSRA